MKYNQIPMLILSIGLGWVAQVSAATQADLLLIADIPNAPKAVTTQASVKFPESVRLDQLIQQGMNQFKLSDDQIDWDNSRLFDLSNPFDLPNQIVQRLEEKAAASQGDKQQRIRQLMKFIQQSHFARRIFQPIDWDLIRLNVKLNPLLNGQWQLVLAKQPANAIWIVGNIDQPGRYPWHNRNSARDYLTDSDNLNWLGDDAVVIQPSGDVEQHSLLKWNRDLKEIAPGAIIYLPFSFNTLPVFHQDNLNQQIISLLRQRQS